MSISGRLAKQLTLHEKQAYEGAKAFYRCFLPFVMGLMVAVLLSPAASGAAVLSYKWAGVMGLSFCFYCSALHYYTQCNTIDTTPLLPVHPTSAPPPFAAPAAPPLQAEESALLASKPPRLECKVCGIICDYRTKHCRKCQVCIERFDHHCFWIGNCVGRHNHRPFFLFLLMQTTTNILNCCCLYSLAPILAPAGPLFYAMYLLAQALAAGFVVFTGYLLLYHSMLLASGLTTWEHMRRPRISYLKHLPAGYNPFSRGLVSNVTTFFSEPTRYTGQSTLLNNEHSIPSFQESQKLRPVFNLIDNQYYSCC